MHSPLEQFGFAAALLALGALLTSALRLPALPGYLLIGLLVGPSLDVEILQPVPDLGLMLLLFSVGLEFGPDRLVGVTGRAWRAGLWDALALVLGTLLGLALGLDTGEALLLGGVVFISSSAVIAKLIIDLGRAAYPESEVVLGILVFEDLIIAAVLPLAAGHGGLNSLLATLVVIAVYGAVARFLGGRLAELAHQAPGELLLLLGTAVTIGTAEVLRAAGAPESIGALLAGVLAASLGLRERLEELFGPVRDLAVAFFFLTVGATARSTLDDFSLLAVLVAFAAVLVKLPLNYFSGVAAGLGVRGRLLTALYLIPRGEFTLVLSALALDAGAPFVSQVAVLLVLSTIPVGAVAIQAGPRLTRSISGRRIDPTLGRGPSRTATTLSQDEA